MSIKRNIKKSISEVFLKSQKFPVLEPSGKLINISTANIILFFACYSYDDFVSIQKFIIKNQNSNIKIDTILVYLDFEGFENKETISNFKIITQSDFNIYGSISTKLKDYLIINNFGVLISFANNHDLFCDKIISTISSDFKAGKFHEQNVNLFDLTINHGKEDYNKRFEHFILYLNNLNINI